MHATRCVPVSRTILAMLITTDLYQFEPLTGQGGNSAIETAASLANHLTAALHKSISQTLSEEETSSVFEKVQQQREGRVWGLVKASHARQRLECLETPTLRFIVRYVFPYIPKPAMMNRWIQTYCPAVSLRMLPMPSRPRKIPFHDENLESHAPLGFGKYAVFIALACVAFQVLLNANMILPYSMNKE